MLECVVNVSEGQRPDVIAAVASAAGGDLLDVHTDAQHNRTVLTVVGEAAPRAMARVAVDRIDLRRHRGVHPRLGAVDVVPFVPLQGAELREALAARDRFVEWAARELGVPCFRYGPERSLPEVRRGAFTELTPDAGPDRPHPTAGAMAVGARGLLVAYNLWLAEPDLDLARRIARELRGRHVRALGLPVGEPPGSSVQVSMNLVAPLEVGPAEAYDQVAARAPVARAELVGLIPRAVLDATDPARWQELDFAPGRTIEARLAGGFTYRDGC